VGHCVVDVIPEAKWNQFEEFHASELYGGYGIFEGIDTETRFFAIKTLLSIIPDYKLPIVYGAVDLPKLHQQPYASANAIDTAFRLCLPAIEQVMGGEQYRSGGTEFALLIADDTNGDVKKMLKTSFRQLRRPVRPPHWHPGTWHIHDEMYFGSSKDSVGIQLADLCSYFIGRHLEKDQTTEGFYQIFSDLIVHSKVVPEGQ
jgi:hypothetical protein